MNTPEKLSSKQEEFLLREFGIETVDYSTVASMEDIRLKCFDIEVEEEMACMPPDDPTEPAGENDEFIIDDTVDISERGAMASSIIDALADIIDAKFGTIEERYGYKPPSSGEAAAE